MSRIMVDELVRWPGKAKPGARRIFGEGRESCHLTIDGQDLKPLHAFAASIGLKREWFQPHPLAPHYDLTPRRREAALRAGAVFVSARDQAIARRQAREGGAP
jgi:Protein of unknown function (DUF4031)